MFSGDNPTTQMPTDEPRCGALSTTGLVHASNYKGTSLNIAWRCLTVPW